MAANSGEPFSSQPVPAPYAPPPVAPARRRSPWLWVGLGCAGLILLSICGFIAVSAGLIGALAGAKTPTPAISGGTSVPAGQSSGLAGVGQTSTKGNWAVTLDKVDRTQRVGSSTT